MLSEKSAKRKATKEGEDEQVSASFFTVKNVCCYPLVCSAFLVDFGVPSVSRPRLTLAPII